MQINKINKRSESGKKVVEGRDDKKREKRPERKKIVEQLEKEGANRTNTRRIVMMNVGTV